MNIKKLDKLMNKVAIITGGSRGIGKAIATELARQGCCVLLLARELKNLEKTQKEINNEGGKSYIFNVDIGNPKEVNETIERIKNQFNRIDILVNNAGIGIFSPLIDFGIKEWQEVINTNLNGVFYITKAVLPMMIKQREGAIINISSLAGKNYFVNGSAYCASKAALIALSECLMLEVRNYNIKVCCLLPGSVNTEFSGRKGKEWMLKPEDIAEQVINFLMQREGALVSQIEIRPLKPEK